MGFWLKVGSVFLSLSIVFTPTLSYAKQKKHIPSKKSISSKVSKSSIKSKKHKRSFTKRDIVKVSYSYGPKVYAAENIEPNTEIYKYAIGLLGTKYRFGGDNINGIDCSSFVQNVFELAGYKMPRTAREQARYGYFVRKEDIKPGDLLFFATYASFPSHVGIYIGDGKMIHASSRGDKVEITPIDNDYYQKRFLFAKRIPANSKIEDLKDLDNYIIQNNTDPIANIIREYNKRER